MVDAYGRDGDSENVDMWCESIMTRRGERRKQIADSSSRRDNDFLSLPEPIIIIAVVVVVVVTSATAQRSDETFTFMWRSIGAQNIDIK